MYYELDFTYLHGNYSLTQEGLHEVRELSPTLYTTRKVIIITPLKLDCESNFNGFFIVKNDLSLLSNLTNNTNGKHIVKCY